MKWLLVAAVVASAWALVARRTRGCTTWPAAVATPFVAAAADDMLIALSAAGDVWTWPPTGQSTRPKFVLHLPAAPLAHLAVADSLVIAAGAEGTVVAASLRAEGRAWHIVLPAPPVAPPGVSATDVFFPLRTAVAACVERDSGRVRWLCRLPAPARAQPVWWKGRWWVAVRGQKVVAVSAAGKVLLGRRLQSPAATACVTEAGLWLGLLPHGVALIRADGGMASVGLASAPTWLVPAGESVLAVSGDGTILALAPEAGGIQIAWRQRIAAGITAAVAMPGYHGMDAFAIAGVDRRVRIVSSDGSTLAALPVQCQRVAALGYSSGRLLIAGDDGAWICQLP